MNLPEATVAGPKRVASRLPYRPDIDGIRAIAVLAVVGFHALPGYVRGGFVGVDIFFVLSGYLITSLVVSDADEGRFALATFYSRRIRRLFPAALTVVAATAVAGWLLLFSHEYARLVRHAFASLFFAENLLLANEAGYFDAEAAKKPLLHFWSLAVEEQFYLVWPVVLFAAMRRPAVVGALIVLVMAASFALAAAGTLPAPWDFYSPLPRAWELAVGAGLAWLSAQGRMATPRPMLREALVLGALAVIATAIVIGPRGLLHPGWFTLAPVAATAVLLWLAPETMGGRLLARRPAVGIGLISYPLYLWHWPLLAYTLVVLDERGSTLLRAGLMALAVVLAWATWRWIERPLRFSWPPHRAVLALLGATAALAAALGLSLIVRPAATDRAAAVAEAQLEGVDWRYTANDLCRRRHPQHVTAFCLQSGDADPVVLFVGNSYVNHLMPGLMTHPRLRSVPMLDFGNCELSRTFPPGKFGRDQCDGQFRLLERYDSVRLVVTSNMWPMFDGNGKMSDLAKEEEPRRNLYPDAATYAQALRKTYAEIASKGVPVILVGPKPELGYDAAACQGRPLRPAQRNCVADRKAFEREAAVTIGILRGIARDIPNVHYFDPVPLFCDDRSCRFIAPDGTPWLRDLGHFSVAGSERVADAIVRWAPEAGIKLPSDGI